MSARRLCLALIVAAGLATAADGSVDAFSPAAASSAAGPAVTSMIVGTGGAILSPARGVTAGATTARVGHKSCAVASGTPLAVLAAARRLGGPGFAVRDYGRCGSSQANSGQNGWEYKVDNLAGSSGAGDASGPRGDGRRLRSGARVLWFWCNAAAGGCQRTLAVSLSPATVTRGGHLRVTVTGYDNDRRGTPIGGAIVTLGSDFASTDSAGRATLIAPSAPARYPVEATRRGLVPSFPETIVVR